MKLFFYLSTEVVHPMLIEADNSDHFCSIDKFKTSDYSFCSLLYFFFYHKWWTIIRLHHCLTCDIFAEHQLLYQLLNTQYLLYIVIWSSYYMVLQYYYIKANLVNILLVVTRQKVKRSSHVAYVTYCIMLS